jgi:hypothetical protein
VYGVLVGVTITLARRVVSIQAEMI